MKKLMAVLAFLLSLIGVLSVAACAESQTAGEEAGEYYCDDGNAKYALTLTDDCKFTLRIDSEKRGSYTPDGGELTLNAESGETYTASYRSGTVTLGYGEKSYRFLRKVDYTVTFDSAGGSAVGSVKVRNGRTAARPNDPEKAGQVFVGWYSDSACSNVYSFATPVTGDITVYAKYVTPVDPEFTATFAEGGFEAKRTAGGKLYDLPVPEKSGAVFAGWWVSHYEDPARPTYRYTDQTLEENVTLYAVWESDIPLVSVTEKGVEWTSVGVNASYSVKITAPDGTVTSDTVGTTDYSYSFTAAGDYVIEVSANGQTGKAYYCGKRLARVSVFEVEGNILKYNAVSNAANYFVTVDCGTEGHAHDGVDNGGKTTFDLSGCDMPAKGISVTVRAHADGYTDSVSAEFIFKRTLDRAAVQANGSEEIVWQAVEYADSYDVTVLRGATTVYSGNLKDTVFSYKTLGKGNYTVRVTPVARGWLSPSAAELSFEKKTIATPSGLKLKGTSLEWEEVDGATGYEVKIGDKTVSVKEATYAIESAEGQITVSVRATAQNAQESSLFSDVLTLTGGEIGEVLYRAGRVSWDAVWGAEKYSVKVNGKDEQIVSDTSAKIKLSAPVNSVTVAALKADGTLLSETELTVEAHTVTLKDGEEESQAYFADGDPVELPVPEKDGYGFGGWARDLAGENEYRDATFAEGRDIDLFAQWVANKYTVTLISEGQVYTTATAGYLEAYELPIPTTDDVTKAFFGWFAEDRSTGERYTTGDGKSINPYPRTENITMYAGWIDIFTFSRVNGGQEYSVSQGVGINYVTTITIPQSYGGLPVTTVQDFSNCTSLEVINIPDTVKLISLAANNAAFQGCKALKAVNIIYEAGNHDRFYESEDGVLIYNNPVTGNKELKFYPLAKEGAFTIPEGVTLLPTKVFYSTKVTDLTVASTVRMIETQSINYATILERLTFLSPETVNGNVIEFSSQAIYNCSKLTEITFPSNMLELPADGISSCSAIRSIEVDDANPNYYSLSGVLCRHTDKGAEIVLFPRGRGGTYRIPAGIGLIGVDAFRNNANLTEIIIPGYVSVIESGAFAGNSKLSKATFEGIKSDSPLSIGASAFYSTKLTELILPENLQSLGVNAFGNVTTLTEVTVNTALSDVTFANNAFASTGSNPVTYITHVILSEKAPMIDISGVFGARITAVDVLGDNPNYTSHEGVLYNKTLTSILYYPMGRAGEFELPDSVVTVGANVFKDRTYLSKITFGTHIQEIGASAFENCIRLTEIAFKNMDSGAAVTIGASAFKGCTKLTEIELPRCVSSIGQQAFMNCSVLETVKLNEGLKTIGQQAFEATALTSITIPSTVEELVPLITSNESALTVFDKCELLESIDVAQGSKFYASVDGILYKLTDGEPTDLVFASHNKSGAIVIPHTIKEIWRNAFKGNRAITKIEFDGDLTGDLIIASYAFQDCTGLTDVTLPVGVTSLGMYMFSGCSELRNVILPEGLIKIGSNAFQNCVSIERLTIPSTVEEINFYSFYNLKSLVELTFAETPEGAEPHKLEIKDGGSGVGAFTNCSSLRELRFPERTTYIGNYNFGGCTSLKLVYIPSTVTKISYSFSSSGIEEVIFAPGSQIQSIVGAFSNTKLERIELPEGLEMLGSSTFSNTPLKKITIPASVTSIGTNCFQNCGLVSVTFADGSALTSLQNSIFLDCHDLQSVDFGNNSNLATFGSNVFKNCYALSSITLPASLKTIGANDFESARNLAQINFEANSQLSKIDTLAFKDTGLTSFAFPETTGTITLGAKLFQNCKSLKTVHISASVASVDNVFAGCSSIETVTVSKDNPNLKFENGMLLNLGGTAIRVLVTDAPDGALVIPTGTTEIGGGAFMGHAEITSVFIPRSVTVIGANAFQGCVNLKTVEFEYGSALNSLGAGAFAECWALEAIELPANVQEIGASMFNGCKSLTKVELGNMIKSIGESAFRLTGITDITIPESVKSIGNYAFANSALETVVLPSNLTTMGTYVFQNCVNLADVDFNNNRVILSLGNNDFDGCTSLRTITLPDSLTHIGVYTFQNSGLETIDLSNLKDMTRFGSSATGTFAATTTSSVFNGCKNLHTVILPPNLTMIGSNAFRDCVNLTEFDFKGITGLASYAFANTGLRAVHLDNTLTVMGGNLFQDCADLEEVTFAQGFTVTSLGSNTFTNCKKLTSIDLPASLTYIGYHTFQNSGLQRIDLSALKLIHIGVTATGKGTETDIGTFSGCEDLTEVILPTTLQTIGGNVFENCPKLKTVTNLDRVQMIGFYAFQNSGIEEVMLGSSLTDIKRFAFYNTMLTEVTIPSKVSVINEAAFGSCKDLTAIHVEDNEYFKDVDGVLYTMEDDLVCYPAGKKDADNVIDLKNAKAILGGALSGCSFDKIDFSEKFTTIGNYAFYEADVEEFTIPATVTSIGGNAFSYSTLRRAVMLNAAPITSTGKCASMFQGCLNLTEVVLPEDLLYIPQNMFNGCIALENFELPASVTSVSNYAFAYTAIRYMDLSGVKTFGTYVFTGSAIEEVKFGNQTTSIGTYMFVNTQHIETITLSESITTISTYAFQNSAIKNVIFNSAVTTIASYAFSNCAVERIEIPDSVTSLSSDAFSGCTALTYVKLPRGITSLSMRTFSGCANLETVVIPDTITKFSSNAFKDCTSLKLVVPGSVTAVDANAFDGMTEEQTLYIESSAAEVFAGWTTGWNWGCNAKIVFGYKAD